MNKRNETNAKPPLSHIDAWEDMAMDYLDGSLSTVDAAAVEAHLHTCSECRDAIRVQIDVMNVTRAVPEASVPPELSALILDALTAGASAPSVKDAGRRNEARGPGMFQRLMDRLAHAPWAPAAVALLVVAVGVAAWGGITSQTARRTTGDSQGLVTTSVREDGNKTAATSDQETASQEAGATAAAGATTTAAAATTTFMVDTGSTQVLTTTGTLVTSSLTTLAPEATTLVNPSTTRTAGSMLVALGLTPVLLTVSTAGVPPTGGIAQTFQEIAGMRPLPSTLWSTVPTYAEVMDGSDLDAMVEQLRRAGLDASTQDARMVYDQDYLDSVASELGLSPPADKDTLVIAVLSGG